MGSEPNGHVQIKLRPLQCWRAVQFRVSSLLVEFLSFRRPLSSSQKERQHCVSQMFLSCYLAVLLWPPDVSSTSTWSVWSPSSTPLAHFTGHDVVHPTDCAGGGRNAMWCVLGLCCCVVRVRRLSEVFCPETPPV